MPPRPELPLLILGAGLAGLSMACALLEEGVRAPIVVVDRRTRWDRDRTWCLWHTRPTRFAELASHRWSAWQVTAAGRSGVARSTRHPYLHLDSATVYAHALARLAEAPNVELRVGEAVLDVSGDAGALKVRTSVGHHAAAAVFDALGPGSPLLRGVPRGGVELAQRFLGWEVEVEVPAFDPGVATLMDFRGDAMGGLRFLYVLPFSRTRALVEDTSIGGCAVAPPVRRAALEADLRARCSGGSWRVLYEERGNVPMSTRAYPLHHARGVHAVGAAAGAIRPSSGYAFARTQAHCTKLARAVARGTPLPERLTAPRLAMLDTIFLTALAAEPERFPEVFLRMAQRVPGDAFARFMSDASTPADEARIIAALPKRPFMSAALRSGATAALHSVRQVATTRSAMVAAE